MSRSLELLQDACAALPHTARRMFGGHAFFAPNGGMFAGIVSDDEIILKLADDDARAALIDLGGQPWTYREGTRPMTMAQWIVVPAAFYDDDEARATWVRRAHALAPPKAARRPRATRAKATPRAKPKANRMTPAKATTQAKATPPSTTAKAKAKAKATATATAKATATATARATRARQR